MSSRHSGAFAWALGLTLAAVGCGPSHTNESPAGAGSAGAAGTPANTGGSQGQGATGSGGTSKGGATSNGGTAGEAMLPPDGDVPPATALHKLDLLLMVDNSLNTAEKQRLLNDAVTWLLAGNEADAPALSADDIHVG